jgi:hypothetical protein
MEVCLFQKTEVMGFFDKQSVSMNVMKRYAVTKRADTVNSQTEERLAETLLYLHRKPLEELLKIQHQETS